jgi:hypothetical protein
VSAPSTSKRCSPFPGSLRPMNRPAKDHYPPAGTRRTDTPLTPRRGISPAQRICHEPDPLA